MNYVWLFNILIWGKLVSDFTKNPVNMSMTRAILYKFGGYAVWNGYFYKALDEELFINASPRPSEVRFALYSELEEWDKCSEMFQRNILPHWDLKSGIEDAEFFGLFFRGNECMSHNGEYSANLFLFRSIHPLSDEQAGYIEHMVKAITDLEKKKNVHGPYIKITVEHLKSKKFVAGVDNPLIYVHYGRIFILVLFFAVFRDMRKYSTVKKSVAKVAIIYGCYYIISRELPDFLLLLVAGLGGWRLIFENGWRQGVTILFLLLALILHSFFHDKSMPTRLCPMGGMAFPQNLERARAQYIKYPYHMDDLEYFTGFNILFFWMQREGAKCQLNIPWISGDAKQRNESCRNANDAAKVILEMLEATDSETSEAMHIEFKDWLTNAMFAEPTNLNLSIAEQNFYRVEKGVPVQYDELFVRREEL